MDKFIEIMKIHGKQAELARICGVHRATINVWVGRRFVPQWHLDAVAEFIGIDRDELVVGRK
jgi:DNA-binding transcriptional regulator YdaS (Cro superfamily)